MIRLFFTLCALVVTITLVYHFVPSSANTATVIGGFSMSYLLITCLIGGVVFWRVQSK